jgi:Flp pilus assembly protein TadD
VKVTTESLLMEGARRIDEWSSIADKVPSLGVVPALATMSEAHESQLDLLPSEWEVLSMIDGERDLRAIAATLKRPDFEIAKVAYGLATTGVIEIHQPLRSTVSRAPEVVDRGEAASQLELGFTAVRAGNLMTARSSFERVLQLAPGDPEATRARDALDAVNRLISAMEMRVHA